jgi:RNA polymerase sigma-70 factor (ECF subfamily)
MGWQDEDDRTGRFRMVALSHLDDVYTLARYLLGNAADAEDAAQEAFLRAFRHFDTFRDGDIRPWLFAILRNVCRSIRKPSPESFQATDDAQATEAAPLWVGEYENPEAELLRQHDAKTIRELMAALPEVFREVIVLREINDLSYRQIADIIGVPVGTVMSRLARGRAMLRQGWTAAHARSK